MKKLIFLFSMILVSFALQAQAQELVQFKLQKGGTFLAEDGKSYIVVEYEGKSAQELYTMVKSNVLTLYKSPKNVMSENEPVDITIRALSSELASSYKIGQGFVSYRAYYNYVFHFKDGRIKVDAPVIDSRMHVDATGTALPKTFADFVKGWFEKSGEVKKKKASDVQKIEAIFNLSINYLLGNIKSESKTEEDDW